MFENPHDNASPSARRAPAPVAGVPAGDAPESAPMAPAAFERDPDPVTDWLLEQDDLDTAEFTLLFGIHKLRSRPGRAGWIDHGELCRSTGLGIAELGGVLRRLRRRGLLGMARHPVRTGRARYLLIARGPGADDRATR